MKTLFCDCGQMVYCENTQCGNCGNTLGFDPILSGINSVSSAAGETFQDAQGNGFQFCANRRQYQVCNGLVPLAEQPDRAALCSACRLNRTIPVVERRQNLLRWQRLELAKRRMIAGLATLGLHVGEGNNNPAGPMRFDFKEDKRSHPDVLEHFVSTGHKDGVITINVMEADEIQRVQQRELSGERYRTLLGHFRHEAGHYFYPQLVTNLAEFSSLFGDPGGDYQQALQLYYDGGPEPDWGQSFISAYASSHPLEDWAECFAHFLHIQDALETANAHGLAVVDMVSATLAEQLGVWAGLVVSLNEINRSLGVRDSYPFIINTAVRAKLEFVQQTIRTFAAGRC